MPLPSPVLLGWNPRRGRPADGERSIKSKRQEESVLGFTVALSVRHKAKCLHISFLKEVGRPVSAEGTQKEKACQQERLPEDPGCIQGCFRTELGKWREW